MSDMFNKIIHYANSYGITVELSGKYSTAVRIKCDADDVSVYHVAQRDNWEHRVRSWVIYLIEKHNLQPL